MKKTMLITILVASILSLGALAVRAADPVAFSTNVTVTAGSGSFTYPASGIVKPYAESFKVLAIIGKCTAGLTNSYSVVDGTVTNFLGTGSKVVAAGDAALAVTTDWPHFAGSKVLISSGDTNTFTATIIGVEE
jgi:hypothetical protein